MFRGLEGSVGRDDNLLVLPLLPWGITGCNSRNAYRMAAISWPSMYYVDQLSEIATLDFRYLRVTLSCLGVIFLFFLFF